VGISTATRGRAGGERATASSCARLGHSLGLQTHRRRLRTDLGPSPSNPFLRNTSVVAEGQVFTVEPGCYFIGACSTISRDEGRHRLEDVGELSKFGGLCASRDDLVVTATARHLTAKCCRRRRLSARAGRRASSASRRRDGERRKRAPRTLRRRLPRSVHQPLEEPCAASRESPALLLEAREVEGRLVVPGVDLEGAREKPDRELPELAGRKLARPVRRSSPPRGRFSSCAVSRW